MTAPRKARTVQGVAAVVESNAKSTTKSMMMTTTTTTIQPWPTYRVESKGDYRQEAWLETHIGGPLYAGQVDMPRLPVPSLHQTVERFLPTALPLARTKEEQSNLRTACAKLEEEASALQRRLVARQQSPAFGDSSWLQLWWNQMGYLQVRDPLVVYSSYFFSFVDDPTIVATAAGVHATTTGGGSTPANVQRAATLLFAAAEFRKLVITGQLPQERIGKKKQTSLCATAYKYMFNACRIPGVGSDTYRIYDPSRYTHAIVARKGHFFAIELVHPKTGNPLPMVQLEDQIYECVRRADRIPSSRRKLGLLTSQNRDDWARARQDLIEQSHDNRDTMAQALERLESGAILLNLDDESPVSRQECGELFWTGGLKSGENRWFDKSIELMVTNNGKAGLIAEHSMMDGMPVINFANYITGATYANAKRRSVMSNFATIDSSVTMVNDIFAGALAASDRALLERHEALAWSAFSKLISDHVLHVQSFQAYGSSFIKRSGFPPDAFVQVAMQLATYRLFGEQVGTYEATQVRSFLHGRTEVTRAVSLDSEAFVKRMGLRPQRDEENDVSIAEEKIALLRKATTAHAIYTVYAAKAQGVDRHLLGLSLMVDSDSGEALPSLFSDPVFVRSKRWRSSTSNLSHPRFNLWGYGEVVPDGVGLAYAVLPHSCIFNITALKSTGWTDKLAELLEEALLEMKSIVEKGRPPKGARSKL